LKRLLICTLAVLLLPCAALADEISTSAKACVVIDMDSGRILLEHNANQALPMASTTKIMTALMALENCALDDVVTAGRNAFGVPGTSIYLDLNEALTMEQMLYGLLIASGNDAAVAIAEHVSGSVDGFCRDMTERAREIGCAETVFLTPHGLPQEGHVTTAYELALITREAMRHDTFRTIVSTRRATIPWQGREYDRVLNNKNRLLAEYEGAMGVKTGYTRAAGRCLVTAAERDGMRVICVVLNCYDWFNESERLLDAAFDRWDSIVMVNEGECIRTLDVDGGGGETCGAVLEKDLSGVLTMGQLPSVSIDLPERLEAPVAAGEEIGEIRLTADGEVIGRSSLLAAETVLRDTYQSRLERIWRLWR